MRNYATVYSHRKPVQEVGYWFSMNTPKALVNFKPRNYEAGSPKVDLKVGQCPSETSLAFTG